MNAPPQLRPLRVGEILDVSINIFTKNILTFLKIVAVIVIPIQIVSVIILVSTVNDPDLVPGEFGSTGGRVSSGDSAAYVGGQGVVVVLALILYAMATAACFKAVGDAYLGSKPDWRTSLRFAVRRFHSVLWVTVLVFVASTLWPIGLIVGGIWLWFSFVVAVPALLFEGLKGTKALGRSFRLVRGRWWATTGAVVGAYPVASVVGGVLHAGRGAPF